MKNSSPAMARCLLEPILKSNDLVLSRTARTANVDVSVSPLKQSPMLLGEQLTEAVIRNRGMVSKFIAPQYPYPPTTAVEVYGVLLTLAFLTNLEISPGGLFRLWNYEPPVANFCGGPICPEEIPARLSTIGSLLVDAFQLKTQEDKLALIGGVEWDIGIGPLHPFYDGCGRISRYFSALSSLWLGVPLVRHASRESYMGRASAGRSAFQDYYLTQHRVMV